MLLFYFYAHQVKRGCSIKTGPAFLHCLWKFLSVVVTFYTLRLSNCSCVDFERSPNHIVCLCSWSSCSYRLAAIRNTLGIADAVLYEDSLKFTCQLYSAQKACVVLTLKQGMGVVFYSLNMEIDINYEF